MLAFSCLGEHRQSMGRLFRTIREARGMNYGDYAYIEHFVQDGGSIRPMVNVARTRQEMSVWIRPVQHAHRLFVVKLALRALGEFARGGLTAAELDRTRGFLLGYTRVLEEAMPRRLGYAVDDLFYGIPPFLAGAREAFGRMTLDEVNGAIARNVSFDDLLIVVVTENGAELRDQLAGKKNPPFAYDTPKPAAVLEEDKLVAAFDPGLAAGQITVVPVDSLFAE